MRGASILSDKFIRTARQAREKCGRASERASVGFVTMSLFALFLPLGMASAAQYALWFNAAMCLGATLVRALMLPRRSHS